MASFRYAPLPDDLRSMADELESLGGGDARVGQCEVLVRVRPELARGASDDDARDLAGRKSVWAERDTVLLQDPTVPADEARVGDEHLRRYRCTLALPAETSQRTMHVVLGANVLDWLWAGFNGSVLCMGEAGSGKVRGGRARAPLPNVANTVAPLLRRRRRFRPLTPSHHPPPDRRRRHRHRRHRHHCMATHLRILTLPAHSLHALHSRATLFLAT